MATPNGRSGDEVGVDSAGTRWRWRFEDVEFDEATLSVHVAGQPVAVEPKPLLLLAELLRHVNEAVTREELFEAVWAGQVTVDHVLASAVNRLRKALGSNGAARLVTLPRIGYRLNGPVERTAASATTTVSLALEAGQAIATRPGFRLHEPLGAGSGGEVWLARHLTLGEQRVFKFAATSAQLRALKREYTLHRLLRAEIGEVEGLAPLLDAQLSDPPFHLESPWIGPDLARWASASAEWASMDADARIEMLRPSLRALATAHAVGVLHKDIKPSNLLVDGTPDVPRAWLADFGSGQAQDPERLHELGLTALGLTLTDQDAAARAGGTVLYLAPELLAGRAATTQSDLYAFGLVLFQCVVGDFRRPLSGAWQEDIGCELLREDIALATAADPERRLSGVAELLARLDALPERRRSLQQKREEAARAARAQAQLAQVRARRPWLLAAAAALVLGLGAALAAGWSADRQRRVAEAESARADAVGQFLQRDVLQSASVIGIGRSFKPQSLLDVLRRASGAANQRFANQPLTEGDLRRRLTETYIELAAFPEADAESARAVELLAAHAARSDEALLLARFERVRVHTWRERYDDAQRELQIAEEAAGPARLHADTPLAHAAVRARLLFTSHVAFRPLAPHLATKAVRQSWLPLARRHVQLADALAPSHGTDRAAARQALAEALWAHQQHAEARVVLQELTRPPFLHRSAVLEFDARLALVAGQKARHEGRLDEAAGHFAQGAGLLAGDDDDTNDFTLAWIEYEAGQTRLMQGRGEDALALLRQAQQRFRVLLGPEHHYIMSTERDIGLGQLLAGRPEQALIHVGHAEAEDLRLLGHKRLESWNRLLRAMAFNDLGRGSEASRWLDGVDAQALARQLGMPGLASLVTAERGRALLQQGRLAEGRALLAQARRNVESGNLWPALARRLHASSGSD